MNLNHINLETPHIQIHPFCEADFDGLINAGKDANIWTHYIDANDGNETTMRAYLQKVLDLQNKGEWLAHTICDANGNIIGQSCYMALRLKDLGLEIGGTWYSPKAWGTKINPAAKLALLENAFASGAKRVELKTDALNQRSRAAITKLGAKFEGIFRNHMLRPNGTMRDSAYFSIIDSEWDIVKANLLKRLEN